MKLVILGASGGCGRLLVAQAVARGHQVTAVARPAAAIDAPAAVRLLRGDLFDLEFLTAAVRGQDAVLSALGLRLPGLSPFARAEVPDLLSRSSPLLVQAMRQAGVSRLLAISAGGVGDSYARMPGVFKLFIKLTALRRAYVELEAMEQIFFASGLDVCCPRPTGLTDDPATGRVVVAERLRGRATIPRADVAAWMLDQVERPAFTERAPLLTVTGAA